MDRKRTYWTFACIAAASVWLSGCGSLSAEQPRLPPKEGEPLARPALVPDAVLAVSKAVPEAGTEIVTRGQQPAQPPVQAARPPAAPPDVPDPAVERTRALQQALQSWQAAWQQRDADAYLRAYDPRYKGTARSRQVWERDKRRRLAAGPITVRISEVNWTRVTADEAEVRFLQHFEQGRYHDVGDKTLRLRRIDGAWRITHESWKARRGR